MFAWLSPSKAEGAAESATSAEPMLPPGTICHTAVWCDGCGQSAGAGLSTQGLIGKRFKCLVCPNVDLCQQCFVGDKGPEEHSSSHHMLVFPTPAPEVLQTFAFPGLKCAYCARSGFYGAAYTCTACPPPAAGAATSIWCESCELQALHDKTHARIKRVPPTSVPTGAPASTKK